MIPKKIHYCWFGRGEMPGLVRKCITSWKRYLPEYEIKEWNEDNFDINCCPYVREAYDNRRFAFVSDVVRLYALYNEGGIYMDTDVEILKPLDSLLSFDAVLGFESDSQIATSFIGSHARMPFILEFLKEYQSLHFVKADGGIDMMTNVERITQHCVKSGLVLNNTMQTINGITFLPKDYLCPKSYEDGKIIISENTLAIHHFAGSWYTPMEKFKQKVAKFLGKRMSSILSQVKGIFVKK